MDWLTDYKLPLGKLIKTAVDWLNANAAWLFDAISSSLGFVIDGLIDAMQWCPPLLLVALFVGLSFWLHRSWKLSAFVLAALLLIINLGYWEETVENVGAGGVCRAGLHADRRAARYRGGPSALALHRASSRP